MNREVFNFHCVVIDLFSHQALLFRCRGNLNVHITDLLNRITNTFKRMVGFLCSGNGVGGGVFALIHGTGNRICTALQFFNHGANFGGGLLSTLSERANFVCNHSESSARFACSSGLDGGVQCQQVGLIGNVVDYLQDGFDVRCCRFKHLNFYHCLINAHGKIVYRLCRVTNNIGAINGSVVRHFRCRGSALRVRGDIGRGGGHFMHCGSKLFQFT
ncbi:hypothetical protein [Vibrio vulnificus YJ016]|uniref:Uncharacterized protein n=1 Tax=Vibrio vulnificus (strain YJ016) TaxID=196600 RepID=Q7MF85_VIBVY|nr:hypothetical protein [Vibrio vulnificus YJ016]